MKKKKRVSIFSGGAVRNGLLSLKVSRSLELAIKMLGQEKEHYARLGVSTTDSIGDLKKIVRHLVSAMEVLAIEKYAY